ncbi:hypothetical protein LX12_001367 [Williamsia serinedens]|uniref:Transposase n=1 Tax=Williamsia serinedens TaxID=391736 RepID=A0ABT1H0W8_9NOCA|nr:hypothetical protein [Williamsia serinedens]
MTDHLPAYTPDRPSAPSADELRARIPGWGADLDPKDRPSVPKLQQLDTGAHWRFPERQPEHGYRERSIEHRFLTPVFGTAQPLEGLPGRLRRVAYDRFSEGRAAHWLILLYTDRLDALIHHVRRWAPPAPTTRSRRPASVQNCPTEDGGRVSGASGSTSTTPGSIRSSWPGRGS